ncbi:hypothetical protein WN51_08229 [Melipona quadrifasciata]|uniref:Uncharacterized protein n=1 Tax=Melipona quadrifasciata TaxID=166423 RepID=A0A0M8ZQ25_9HYME|nr:hypothetical protein WN51_08229 [Melipona quadrifasciata]
MVTPQRPLPAANYELWFPNTFVCHPIISWPFHGILIAQVCRMDQSDLPSDQTSLNPFGHVSHPRIEKLKFNRNYVSQAMYLTLFEGNKSANSVHHDITLCPRQTFFVSSTSNLFTKHHRFKQNDVALEIVIQMEKIISSTSLDCESEREMSFVNGTMMILAYTANMIATLPERVDENTVVDRSNVTTTTLSPEERENQFDFDDRKCPQVTSFFPNLTNVAI